MLILAVSGLVQPPRPSVEHAPGVVRSEAGSPILFGQIARWYSANAAGRRECDCVSARGPRTLLFQHTPHQLPAERWPDGNSLPAVESEDCFGDEEREDEASQDTLQAIMPVGNLPTLHVVSVYIPNRFCLALDRCIGLSRLIL